MVFALVYLLLRRLVGWTATSSNEQLDTEVELVVLRHQLKVLRRQMGRPRLRRQDRLFMAAISRVLPRARWAAFGSAPRRSFGGTGSWCGGSGPFGEGPPEAGHRSQARFATSSCGWAGRIPGGVHQDPGRARQARHPGLGDQDPDAAARQWHRSGSPPGRSHLEHVPALPGRRDPRAGLLQLWRRSCFRRSTCCSRSTSRRVG